MLGATEYRPLVGSTFATRLAGPRMLPAVSMIWIRPPGSADPVRNGLLTLVMLSPTTPESLPPVGLFGSRVGVLGRGGGVVSMVTRRVAEFGPLFPARSTS